MIRSNPRLVSTRNIRHFRRRGNDSSGTRCDLPVRSTLDASNMAVDSGPEVGMERRQRIRQDVAESRERRETNRLRERTGRRLKNNETESIRSGLMALEVRLAPKTTMNHCSCAAISSSKQHLASKQTIHQVEKRARLTAAHRCREIEYPSAYNHIRLRGRLYCRFGGGAKDNGRD